MWPSGKGSDCQCRRLGFDLWVRKIPWRKKWQPTPVFLTGKSHGQRSRRAAVHGVTRVRRDLVTNNNATFQLKCRSIQSLSGAPACPCSELTWPPAWTTWTSLLTGFFPHLVWLLSNPFFSLQTGYLLCSYGNQLAPPPHKSFSVLPWHLRSRCEFIKKKKNTP